MSIVPSSVLLVIFMLNSDDFLLSFSELKNDLLNVVVLLFGLMYCL